MRSRLSVFATLWLVALMAVMGSGASAQAPTGPAGAAQTERTEGEAVGASIVHPAGWVVEREPYTYDGSYGYTLWRPQTDAAHDHGGMPAIRVALAYDLGPGQIEDEVRRTLADHEGEPPLGRTTVGVGREGHEGVAVGVIPGSTPFTRVYVPVNGRVYRINVYAEKPGEEGLDAEDRELLSAIRFYPPQRSVRSLDLPGANSPEALYRKGDPDLLRQEEAAHQEAASEGISSLSTRSGGTRVPRYKERRIKQGCWRAKSPFFFQTQHGKYANKGRYSKPHGGSGWSRIGLPNYWGQYTHGNLDYGRCDSRNWTNDKFAIDYPLTKGDVVFSPFKRGKITFAGRNESHKNYGIFVVIKHTNGKYVSMSAHLSGLNWRVAKRGRAVTDASIVGYAGKSGDPSIPVGPVHLHQAFYRYPKFLGDGSPYGGAGLKVIYHRYVGHAAGNGGGVYKFGWSHKRYQKAKGDFISN